MIRFHRRLMSVVGLLLIGSLAGCTTFHLPFVETIPKATATDPAVEILCLWRQGEGQDPDGRPCKGFNGNILFLSQKASAPVQIDGEVRIYLFDDQGTVEEQSKPYQTFNFDSGSWSVHLAKTSLGPSYSVFIPYTRKGTIEANCALRVRLKPKRGPVVFSEFSNMPLNGSGKAKRGEEAKPLSTEEVDQLAADAMAASLCRTTTISTKPSSKDTDAAKGSSSHSDQILQASYEAPSPSKKSDTDVARIQQLEATVQQLMKQIAQGTTAAASNDAPENVEHADLSEVSREPSDRLRLNPPRRIRRQVASEPAPRPIRRQAHPLDDDQPELSAKSAATGHSEKSSTSDPFEDAVDISPSH
jgi:hypothetical protein